MFQGVMNIVYKVTDIEKAKQWYGKILNAEPILDIAFITVFRIGDVNLGLLQSTNTETNIKDNNIIYWKVDDIDTAYKRLLEAGATKYNEIESGGFGTKRASVIDPFGNILGIASKTDETIIKTVEQKPSRTAMGIAFLRALAYKDKRDEIGGSDYLAEIFLTEEQKASIKDKAIFDGLNNSRPGIYEFITARTAFFDHIVKQALIDNIPQIVCLGAGYDTRAYRFRDLIKDTEIFEVDINTTQQYKKELLQKSNIDIPKHLTYVSINFNKDKLKDVLSRAGYSKDKKTLFIWEGVIYYLLPKAVEDTLDFIRSNSLVGSRICFDYAFTSPDMYSLYGVKQFSEYMRTNHPDESARFGIAKGKIDMFLSERGFKLIEHLNADDMEKKYLTLQDGSSVGKVLGNFCLVDASVVG